jgi:hypothetical protein
MRLADRSRRYGTVEREPEKTATPLQNRSAQYTPVKSDPETAWLLVCCAEISERTPGGWRLRASRKAFTVIDHF